MILHHWHHWLHDNRMCRFSDETCFSKTVLIYMVYQLTSSSEDLFFLIFRRLFTYQLHHYSTSTYQLHHLYLSTSLLLINLISFSFKLLIFWQLPSCFRASSFFLSFSGCCKFWLPCTWWKTLIIFMYKIHRQIGLKKGNAGIA